MTSTSPIFRIAVYCFLAIALFFASDLNAKDANRISMASNGNVTVSSPDGGKAVFAPEFAILYAVKNPNLATRWGQYEDAGLRDSDAGSNYHVMTWGVPSEAVKNYGHVADGYDPDSDRGYGKGRSPDLFHAGQLTYVKPSMVSEKDGKIIWEFTGNEFADITAVIDLPEDGSLPRMTMSAKVKKAGWYSIGYVGAPATEVSEMDEVFQPLIYSEKRFPEGPYLEYSARCTLPTTMVTKDGITTGVLADPDEMPFMPMPTLPASPFGVAVRNQKGQAQSMLFVPIMGGLNSNMKKDGSITFTSRLLVSKAGVLKTYENVARSLFGFSDIRHNYFGSLNDTFENMVAFGESQYAKFNKELRGFAYDTDVPGSVKNVSALHPLSVALVTDSRKIYEDLVYPQVEYFISRERFLFSIHLDAKGQNVSPNLVGMGAPLNEYATLYAATGGRTPWLLHAAEELYPTTRILNLVSKSRGDFWANSMSLYRATGDKKWLDRAVKDADEYLKTRVDTKQTDFTDPDSRGMFFWTSYTPQFIELYELYQTTGNKRYLEAAHFGARDYALRIWMCPKIPEGDVFVNEGNLSAQYRKGPKYTPIKLPEEWVPAWTVSEIGLTPESSGTSRGHRGIMLANPAPYILRIAADTGDDFLHDVARSAVIGRYTSFPGYHLNTARTSSYQKPDFAERPKDELNSATSIHYNHIWPAIAMVLDYLVSDAVAKSGGKVDFPSHYAEGYAYLQQKIYGDRPGKVYSEKDMYLWMPKGVIRVTHPELNYIVARGKDSVAVVLTNQWDQRVTAQVLLNKDLIGIPENEKDVKIDILDENGKKLEFPPNLSTNAAVLVTVPAKGIKTIIYRGVSPKVDFQNHMVGSGGNKLPKDSVCKLDYRDITAVGLLLGANEPARVYAYIPDIKREVAAATLYYRQGSGDYTAMPDDRYPFEYTIPTTTLDPVEFYMDITLKDGKQEKSPVGKVILK